MANLPDDERLHRIQKRRCLDCGRRAAPGKFRCTEHSQKEARRRIPGCCSAFGEPAGRMSESEEHRGEIGARTAVGRPLPRSIAGPGNGLDHRGVTGS